MARSSSASQALVLPDLASPTIKGIFVNSHIEAVRRALGEDGVHELQRRAGAPLQFRDLEDVPIREEVRVIELANDILRGERVPEEERAFEGGRLHFRNFSRTPIAKLMFGIFPRNFRYLMLHCSTIAERVFKGVRFESYEAGPNGVVVVMDNADYALDHFRGLFQEWMDSFGLRGRVVATSSGPRRFEYHMSWDVAA